MDEQAGRDSQEVPNLLEILPVGEGEGNTAVLPVCIHCPEFSMRQMTAIASDRHTSVLDPLFRDGLLILLKEKLFKMHGKKLDFYQYTNKFT